MRSVPWHRRHRGPKRPRSQGIDIRIVGVAAGRMTTLQPGRNPARTSNRYILFRTRLIGTYVDQYFRSSNLARTGVRKLGFRPSSHRSRHGHGRHCPGIRWLPRRRAPQCFSPMSLRHQETCANGEGTEIECPDSAHRRLHKAVISGPVRCCDVPPSPRQPAALYRTLILRPVEIII